MKAHNLSSHDLDAISYKFEERKLYSFASEKKTDKNLYRPNLKSKRVQRSYLNLSSDITENNTNKSFHKPKLITKVNDKNYETNSKKKSPKAEFRINYKPKMKN